MEHITYVMGPMESGGYLSVESYNGKIVKDNECSTWQEAERHAIGMASAYGARYVDYIPIGWRIRDGVDLPG